MEQIEMPECPVCMEYYTIVGDTRPKALKCGHSVCGVCFKQLNPQKCPTCREFLSIEAPFHTEMIAFLEIIQKKRISEIIPERTNEIRNELNKKKHELEKIKVKELEIFKNELEQEKIEELEAIKLVLKYQKKEEMQKIKHTFEQENLKKSQEDRSMELERIEELRMIRDVLRYEKMERAEELHQKAIKEQNEIRDFKKEVEIGDFKQILIEATKRENVEQFLAESNQRRKERKVIEVNEREIVRQKSEQLTRGGGTTQIYPRERAREHTRMQTPIIYQKEYMRTETNNVEVTDKTYKDSIFLPRNYSGEKGKRMPPKHTRGILAHKNERWF